MIKRPVICFLGDKIASEKIINHFGSKIKAYYISRRKEEVDDISSKQPTLICFILEKNQFGHTSYYSGALEYSKRTLCPVYVIGTHDQFDGMKKTCYKSVIRKVTPLGMYRAISNAIKQLKVLPEGNLSLIKHRFDSIVIVSSNAALAAYCESKIRFHNTPNRRIILVSPSSPQIQDILNNRELYAGFVVTEPLNGFELERISLTLAKTPRPKIPLIFLEKDTNYSISSVFSRYNFKDDNDEISKEFSRADKYNLKKLSFGKAEEDEDLSFLTE